MRILMIHPHDLLTFPWTIRIVKLAETLARKGCTVTLCHIPNLARRKTGITVRSGLPQSVRYVELAEGKNSLLANIKTVAALAGAADLVHVQKCFMTAALPGIVAARLCNLPLHYDWDDDESDLSRYWLSGLNRLKISAYERILPKVVTTVSTASICLHDKALRFGALPEDIFDVPVGTDLPEFDELKKRPVTLPAAISSCAYRMVFVGHLEDAHYGDLVLDEFAQVAVARLDIGLIMIGGGSHQGELETRAAQLGLSARVWFTGYLPHENVPAILSRAEIGIACLPDTPFARAGSPIKVLEYMAAGLAVVATAVGEVKRMLGDCGVLLPPGEKGSIARAILELLDDPDRLENMQQSSRARVAQTYSWDRSADNLLAAYVRGFSLRGRRDT